MASYNHAAFVGNVVKDPIIEDDYNGRGKVARFSVAVNDVEKSGGVRHETVSFFDCKAHQEGAGELVNLISRHLKAKCPVLVSGRMKQERWTNRDGLPRSRVVLMVSRVVFLWSKGQPEFCAGGETSEDISRYLDRHGE